MVSIQKSYGNFDLLKTFKLDYADVTISKWKSRITGLSVVHIDYPAPIVTGHIVAATESFDDSGCPHTLEHLVFMGSEKYPYVDGLAKIVARNLAASSNAWTDTDHTAYTASTAGSEGFLQILPVYLDNILYPSLFHSAYVTEVYHVNGEGKDGGVVFCEMQGRENRPSDLMCNSAARAMNPPESAYRSKTGGLTERLRELSLEQICKYHSAYYAPHNLVIIVFGHLVDGWVSLLSVVQEQIEASIIAHGHSKTPIPPGWKRPFLETPSALRRPLPKTVKETVFFPETDESVGNLTIQFLGPAPDQFLKREAIHILGRYLTSSEVAPLRKEYVEIDSPLCTRISFDETVRATALDLEIRVSSIPTDHLDDFDERLRASFERIIGEGIDMERILLIINRYERCVRYSIEYSKEDTLGDVVIEDFLYGRQDGSDIQPSFELLSHYTELRKWTSEQWCDLLKKYYVDPPRVVVRAKPSTARYEELQKEEEDRVLARVTKLGPEGLKRAAKAFEEARAASDKTFMPISFLETFRVPDFRKIPWIPVESVQEMSDGRQGGTPALNAKLAEHLSSDGHSLPFFVQYDHVESNFVSVHVIFSLDNLPNHLRPYLSIYTDAFFLLPLTTQSGEQLSDEDVVNGLYNDAAGHSIKLGEINNELIVVTIEVELAKYERAVAWLRDIIFGSTFTKERLQVVIAKAQQNLPERKRDPSRVLNAAAEDVLFNETSSTRACSLLTQLSFISKVAKELQSDPENVVRSFEELRRHLVAPSSVRIGVTGNVLGVQRPRSILAERFGSLSHKSSLDPVPSPYSTLSPIGKEPSNTAIVMSLVAATTTFAIHFTKAPRGDHHPDIPALLVAEQLLNAEESFLWRVVRGLGLAYGANVEYDRGVGHLSFDIWKSTGYIEAYVEAGKLVRQLADESVELKNTDIDAAKSAIAYHTAERVRSPGGAAFASFVDQALKGISQNHNVELLVKCQLVTKEDVVAVLRKYFVPLFDSSSSIAIVVTEPSKADEIGVTLSAIGFKVSKRTLENESDDSVTEKK